MPGLSAKGREDYLLLLYFGPSPKSPVGRCVRRAYLDLRRTLHGISQIRGVQAHQLLAERLDDLVRTKSVVSQNEFDSWHRILVIEMCDYYRDHGFPAFSVGQAQKWINMTLKYAITFGDEYIPEISRFFGLCHVPIDNIILQELAALGAPRVSARWSRLVDYSEYFSLQTWVRETFPNEKPLAVEFRLWKEGMEKRGQRSD